MKNYALYVLLTVLTITVSQFSYSIVRPKFNQDDGFEKSIIKNKIIIHSLEKNILNNEVNDENGGFEIGNHFGVDDLEQDFDSTEKDIYGNQHYLNEKFNEQGNKLVLDSVEFGDVTEYIRYMIENGHNPMNLELLRQYDDN